MVKSIICYSLGKIEPKKRLKFNQELYGHTNRSHHGRYEYEREGILKSGEYEKPLDATLILSIELAQKISLHLKKYNARYINYQIKD